MAWLTLILSTLKWVRTNWRLCATLAFLCAVAACLLYARSKWIEQGRAEERAKFDLIVRKGKEELAKRDRLNAIAQATAFAKGQAIGESRVRDQQDIIADRDRLIADQRAGIVRLRQQWRGCVSQAEGGSSAGGAGGPQPADELRAAGAADIVRITADADSKVKRLQEFVQVQQKLCEAIQ